MKQAEVAKLIESLNRNAVWGKAGSGHLLTLPWQRSHTPLITDI